MSQLKTMKIGTREYPVVGQVTDPGTGESFPLVTLPMMSAYKWQLRSLQSRFENPELYRAQLGEDVEAVIAGLRRWLEEHIEEATPAEREETAQALAACS